MKLHDLPSEKSIDLTIEYLNQAGQNNYAAVVQTLKNQRDNALKVLGKASRDLAKYRLQEVEDALTEIKLEGIIDFTLKHSLASDLTEMLQDMKIELKSEIEETETYV